MLIECRQKTCVVETFPPNKNNNNSKNKTTTLKFIHTQFLEKLMMVPN